MKNRRDMLIKMLSGMNGFIKIDGHIRLIGTNSKLIKYLSKLDMSLEISIRQLLK